MCVSKRKRGDGNKLKGRDRLIETVRVRKEDRMSEGVGGWLVSNRIVPYVCIHARKREDDWSCNHAIMIM